MSRSRSICRLSRGGHSRDPPPGTGAKPGRSQKMLPAKPDDHRNSCVTLGPASAARHAPRGASFPGPVFGAFFVGRMGVISTIITHRHIIAACMSPKSRRFCVTMSENAAGPSDADHPAARGPAGCCYGRRPGRPGSAKPPGRGRTAPTHKPMRASPRRRRHCAPTRQNWAHYRAPGVVLAFRL